MNSDQIQSIIRTILVSIGAALVTKGVISSTGLEAAAGALATLFAVGWSMWFHAGPDKASAVAVATGTATVAQKVAVQKATQ